MKLTLLVIICGCLMGCAKPHAEPGDYNCKAGTTTLKLYPDGSCALSGALETECFKDDLTVLYTTDEMRWLKFTFDPSQCR